MRRRLGTTPLLRSMVVSGILPSLAALLLLLVFSSSTPAQTETGLITGTVTDPTGAVVVNAAVTVQNLDTNLERKTTTSSVGVYTITSLPPGLYQVRVDAPGFSAKI